jgi:thiol-disulfide isomerase/thioredoxin
MYASNKVDSIPENPTALMNKMIDYIDKNGDSLKSLDYLYFLRIDLPIKKLDELYLKASDKLKNTKKGLELKHDIQWRHKIMQKLKNYTLLDTNSQQVFLSDLLIRKKYTLIDFWGSWCIPCRNDSPNLIDLNYKYSSSDFGIISISEDVNTDTWLESIKTDQTNKWIQLIDKKRFIQNDLGIETIPRKILVNNRLEVVGIYSSNFHGKFNLENDLNSLLLRK